MDKNINTKIKIFQNMSSNSPDLTIRKVHVGQYQLAYIFFESTSSNNEISELVIKSLSNKKIGAFSDITNYLENTIYNGKLNKVNNYNEAYYLLASGYILVCTDKIQEILAFESKAQLDRGVVESTSEPIIRGPKDSFTENYSKNLGLIRKRIKDQNLIFNETIVGRRTQTKVVVSYIKDVADKTKVEKVVKKIKKIDIDGILDSGYIRDFLSKQNSTFPKVISSERPDLVCQSLLKGKIIIMVENSPYALIIPALFVDFFHTSEDYYQKAPNITFTRLLKIFAFFITLITPAIYIAIMTYNPEVIPDKLLISFAVQREGVPFPTTIEVIILMTIFEILKECDIRTPTNMGTSISIVGALVLGESAVNAGLVSPIVVIVVAFTSICSLLFTDIDFINAIRFWRGVYIIGTSIIGIVGFLIVTIIFIAKLSQIKTVGVNYLEPLVPLNLNSNKDVFIKLPQNKLRKRDSFLTKNTIRLGDANEN